MHMIGFPDRREAAVPASTIEPIVFLVDDDVSFREFLKSLVSSAGWHAEAFASAEQFLQHPRARVPSCLVLDIGLPDINGLDVQRRLADRNDLPIIFVTGHADVAMSVHAMKAGAVEFLTKPFGSTALLDAIASAIARSRFEIDRQAELSTLSGRYAALSRREREVMALVVSGLLNKQVAYELGISEITVKAHRGKVMRKMGARTLPDLVTRAAKLASGGEAFPAS